MCGGRAFTGPPFAGRIRINPTKLACFARDDLGASLALIDDREATASVESTAFFCHEAALDAALGGLTNHGYLLFSDRYGKSEKNRPASNPCFWPSGSVIPFFSRRALLSKLSPIVKKKNKKNRKAFFASHMNTINTV
jgi:hypothetical protein